MTAGFNKVSSLLDRLPGMDVKGSLQDDRDWKWDTGPVHRDPMPDFRWPRTDRMPGPFPQPGPSGQGGKWECKYVNEPSKPDWGGGIFDTLPRPTPGNI